MSEELHAITWTVDYSARLTRKLIAEVANSPDGVTDEYREACREWLANNPEGMTRDEFDQLPDGTIVELGDGDQLRRLNGQWWEQLKWDPHTDVLANMTVVSTPAAPTLDDADVVRDKRGGIWVKSPNGWGSGPSVLLVTDDELLTQFGPLTPLLPGPQIGGDQ